MFCETSSEWPWPLEASRGNKMLWDIWRTVMEKMEWDYVRPWMWNQKSMRTWQGSSFTSAVNLLTVHKATARRASQQQFVWPHQGIITVACINMSRIFPIIRQFGVWRRYTSCLCKLRLRSMVHRAQRGAVTVSEDEGELRHCIRT